MRYFVRIFNDINSLKAKQQASVTFQADQLKIRKLNRFGQTRLRVLRTFLQPLYVASHNELTLLGTLRESIGRGYLFFFVKKSHKYVF